MSSSSKDLVRLSDPRPGLDGKRIAFRIERADGATFELTCAIDELGDIFAFLTELAAYATVQSGSASPDPIPGQKLPDVNPIPAIGVGFAPGRSAEETFLLLRLAGVDLVFSVPSSALARLTPDLARIAATLSAGSTKQ